MKMDEDQTNEGTEAVTGNGDGKTMTTEAAPPPAERSAVSTKNTTIEEPKPKQDEINEIIATQESTGSESWSNFVNYLKDDTIKEEDPSYSYVDGESSEAMANLPPPAERSAASAKNKRMVTIDETKYDEKQDMTAMQKSGGSESLGLGNLEDDFVDNLENDTMKEDKPPALPQQKSPPKNRGGMGMISRSVGAESRHKYFDYLEEIEEERPPALTQGDSPKASLSGMGMISSIKPSYSSYATEKKNDFHNYSRTKSRVSFGMKVQKSVDTRRLSSTVPLSQRKLNIQSDEDAKHVTLIAKQLRSNFLFLSIDDAQIIQLAQKFEVVEYEPGSAIIEQESIGESAHGTSEDEKTMYYYILVEGECVVVKDGKQVHGKFGTIKEGTLFGEGPLISKDNMRTATIVATKPSPATETVVLYRLKHKLFRDMMGDEQITKLRHRMRDIQFVIDILSGVDTKLKQGTIIRPYTPSGTWLSKQWKGTILQFVWPLVVRMMVLTALFGLIVSFIIGDMVSYDADHVLLEQLELIGGWWSMLSPLTTFVSTFFLAEAFKLWKRFYWTTRGIQGRFNDISLILASNAARNESDGKLTEGAIAALDDVARIQTLMHQLFWCTVVKRFGCLLSPEGFSYLLSRKLITQNEYASLIEVGENSLGGHHASMTWLVSRVVLAVRRGEINADQAAMTAFYDKVTNLRMLMARIPDMYDGRMPLAYVHFVHLLVRVYILVSPIALFPQYWFWSVIAVGILTLFYDGIFKLSLMFLDPVDNDKQHQTGTNQTVGFDIGVLIREVQNGSTRYKGCAVALPQY